MVVIDEEEFIDLDAGAETSKINPFTGQPAKFKMDKFFGKDMHPTELSQEEIEDILEMFESTEINPMKMEAFPLIEQRPPFYSDKEAIDATLRAAEVATTKMKEAEELTKVRRKERLKLFHNTLKEYLNVECGANYKIK